MVVLDFTIVNVALPSIQRDMGTTTSAVQWVVTGYGIAFSGLLILAGRAGDLIGRRRMFIFGAGLFTLASLTCGLAPDIGVLIAARFVQGAGAAAMMPQIMSVIQVRFDGAARARALSAYTAVLSFGFVAGQVIGGVLVTANLFGEAWRPVFLVNVPIGLAVLAPFVAEVPRWFVFAYGAGCALVALLALLLSRPWRQSRGLALRGASAAGPTDKVGPLLTDKREK